MALPDGMLVAGALYQSAWNRLTGRPAGYGIRDYDIAYFDASDLSYAAEDHVIRRLKAALPDLADRLEPRNQARVHLWFHERFGFAVPPLSSAAEGFARYATIAHAVGIRPDDAGGAVIAPFGLADLFAMRLRPNRALPNGPSHDAKARRAKTLWPEVTVELWDGTRL